MIEQHLCYVEKCEQCQAMFLNEEDFNKHNTKCNTFHCEQCQAMFSCEEDYIRHNKNCNTLEALERSEEGDIDRCVEMVGVMNDERYKEIPRDKWPELFRLGAEAFRVQQSKTTPEKNREVVNEKMKEPAIQIIDTHLHSTYGEQVKAGQWGYRPRRKNNLERDPYDRHDKRCKVGDMRLESELNEMFKCFTNTEKRVIRGLAETSNRKDMEFIWTSEVQLLADALCKGVTNLSSITRKRDPINFRTQLTTITSLLKREFDRVNFPLSYFTTTEDIISTLSLVEKQFKELIHKVKMKNVEQTEEVQLEQIKGSLKRVKRRFREIKKELKKCEKSQNNTSDEEDYEEEGGEGPQVSPSQSSPSNKKTGGTKSQKKE